MNINYQITLYILVQTIDKFTKNKFSLNFEEIKHYLVENNLLNTSALWRNNLTVRFHNYSLTISKRLYTNIYLRTFNSSKRFNSLFDINQICSNTIKIISSDRCIKSLFSKHNLKSKLRLKNIHMRISLFKIDQTNQTAKFQELLGKVKNISSDKFSLYMKQSLSNDPEYIWSNLSEISESEFIYYSQLMIIGQNKKRKIKFIINHNLNGTVITNDFDFFLELSRKIVSLY